MPRMSLLTLSLLLLALPSPALHAQDKDTGRVLDAAQQRAIADVDARTQELADVNQSIWQYAELGLQEHQSSALLEQKLKDNGFTVETGIAGMPTAFVAEYGSGKPVIGILAEYDALPGMSQKSVPYREPVQEDRPGHACGHSGLGTGALGAVLAVKAAMDEFHIPGTIRLYGTPAEETAIGKVYMVLDGVFDDLDVCLHWHPGDKNGTWAGSSKALVSAKFTFNGIPAHGSVSPHEGRSALDAVELMDVGVNFMREHVKEDCRMHYVITDGGGQPNVVPPKATVWYYVRADTHKDVEYYFNWVQDIARGAAMMTRTKLSMQIDTDCHELLPNMPLSEAIVANMELIGAPTFSPEEHAFAVRVQEPLRDEFGTVFDKSLNERIEPLSESQGTSKGSTDVGDISWHVPTGGLRTTCTAAGSPGHSWQNVACIGSSIGEKGIVFAAKSLAATAVQFLEDEELRAAARADFEKRMQGREYTTLIPEGQPAPEAIR